MDWRSGSLATSIAGVLLGLPLMAFCYVGVLIPIVGIAVGAVTLMLQVLVAVILIAVAVNRAS